MTEIRAINISAGVSHAIILTSLIIDLTNTPYPSLSVKAISLNPPLLSDAVGLFFLYPFVLIHYSHNQILRPESIVHPNAANFHQIPLSHLQ